eukprot:GHVU01211029.1.p1 GENE.GHVU01211029.1~~GHVU01211029.1.p1  ORF type:complete len:275 (-),score=18.48 GHVU01211029.1:59-862(-)
MGTLVGEPFTVVWCGSHQVDLARGSLLQAAWQLYQAADAILRSMRNSRAVDTFGSKAPLRNASRLVLLVLCLGVLRPHQSMRTALIPCHRWWSALRSFMFLLENRIKVTKFVTSAAAPAEGSGVHALVPLAGCRVLPASAAEGDAPPPAVAVPQTLTPTDTHSAQETTTLSREGSDQCGGAIAQPPVARLRRAAATAGVAAAAVAAGATLSISATAAADATPSTGARGAATAPPSTSARAAASVRPSTSARAAASATASTAARCTGS